MVGVQTAVDRSLLAHGNHVFPRDMHWEHMHVPLRDTELSAIYIYFVGHVYICTCICMDFGH